MCRGRCVEVARINHEQIKYIDGVLAVRISSVCSFQLLFALFVSLLFLSQISKYMYPILFRST